MIILLETFFMLWCRNRKYFISILWVSALATVATSAYAKADDNVLKFSTGFDYSSGSYGLSYDTDILYVPFSLQYDAFPWDFRITVPYVHITGPGGVIAGADGGVVVGTRTDEKRTTEEGLGDIVLSSRYALDSLLNTSTLLDLTAKVKIGTADETKGLGTGENDYSLQLDIAKKYGKTTPFAMLGYKVMGDPDGLELNDIWYSSAGFDYKINPTLNSGISFDFKEATTPTSEASKEGVAYLNWKLNPKATIMGYGVVGFSDGSPDNGVGVQISIKY